MEMHWLKSEFQRRGWRIDDFILILKFSEDARFYFQHEFGLFYVEPILQASTTAGENRTSKWKLVSASGCSSVNATLPKYSFSFFIKTNMKPVQLYQRSWTFFCYLVANDAGAQVKEINASLLSRVKEMFIMELRRSGVV